MRYLAFLSSALIFCCLSSAQTGTATLTNDSHPWANLESGDSFTISIIAAAPYSEITVVENGGAPYDFGLTDGNGDWWAEGTYTAADVGSYGQFWYVAGNYVPPDNPNPSVYPYATALPYFHI